MAAPSRLRIPHEDFEYARSGLVGTYVQGDEFMAFVTGRFPKDIREVPGGGDMWMQHKNWYAVLHTFDSDGGHIETQVWSGGTTAEGEYEACERAELKLAEMLKTLGPYTLCDV